MRILLDHCTPAQLRRSLLPHDVTTTYFLGWNKLTNGALLSAAESAGFELFITADLSIQYQQNLAGRKIAILFLSPGDWPAVRRNIQEILTLINQCQLGDFQTLHLL